MSLWAWVLLWIWAACVILSLEGFRRTLHILKALKNLYYYKSFGLDLNEGTQAVPRVNFYHATKRLVHEFGFFSFSDLQFDLPPALHAFLFLWFLLFLLLLNFLVGFLPLNSLGFNVEVALLTAVVASSTGVLVCIGTEAVYIFSLNARNRSQDSTQYHMSQEQEKHTIINTAPPEEEKDFKRFGLNVTVEEDTVQKEGLGGMDGNREEVTFRKQQGNALGEEQERMEATVKVEFLLLVLVIMVVGSGFWGLYMIPETDDSSAVLLQWLLGVALDVPIRLLLSGVLSLCGGLPNFQCRFKALNYDIQPSDLNRFFSAPRKPALGENLPTSLIYNPSEDHEERRHFSICLAEETHRQPIGQWPTVPRNRYRPQEFEAYDRYLMNLQSSEPGNSFPEVEPPAQTRRSDILTEILSEESSIAAEDVDPSFQAIARILSNEESIDDCPIIVNYASGTPENNLKSVVFDEFPIPPEVERFRDIESSPSDLETVPEDMAEPCVPSVPSSIAILSPNRHSKPPIYKKKISPLTQTIYGHKQGLFADGNPIPSLRESRSQKGKKVKYKSQLEAIVSENEEDFDGNPRVDLGRSRSVATFQRVRPMSPEAAENTRFQTPISPQTFQEDDIEEFHYPNFHRFPPGHPLPVPSPDPDFPLRPVSPSAAEESHVSFLTSATASSRATLNPSLRLSRRPNYDENASQLAKEILDFAKAAGRPEDAEMKKLSEILANRLIFQRKHGKFQGNYESPYEEILWRMMKDEDRREGSRLTTMRGEDENQRQQANKLQTLYRIYKEGSARPNSKLLRHRSLAPLSRLTESRSLASDISRSSLIEKLKH